MLYFLLFALVFSGCTIWKTGATKDRLYPEGTDFTGGISVTHNYPVRIIDCETIYPNKQYELQLIQIDSIDSDSEKSNTIFRLIDRQSSEEIITDSIFSFTGEIQFEDFNNDNIRDILIQNHSDARSNWTYHLYLVDTAHNKLTKVNGFEEIKNPTLNKDDNVIESFVVSGTDWTGFYVIENDTVKNLGYTIYQEDEEQTDSMDSEGKLTRTFGQDSVYRYIQAQNDDKMQNDKTYNDINWQNRSKVFYTVWNREEGNGYHISKTRRVFIIDDQVFIREFPHGDSRMYKIKELEYQGDSVITAMVDFDYIAFAQYPDVLAGHQTPDWKEMYNPGKSIKKIVLTKDPSTLLWSIDTEDFTSDPSLWIDSYDILPSGYYYQNQRTIPHDPDHENFLPAERPLFSGKYELDEKPIEIMANTKQYRSMERPYEGTWLHISKTAVGDVVYDYPEWHGGGSDYDRLRIKIKGNVISVRYLNSTDMTDSIKFDRVLFYPNDGSYRFYPWAGMCYEFKWVDKERHICQWTVFRINWNTRKADIWGQKTYINETHNNLPVITYDWE